MSRVRNAFADTRATKPAAPPSVRIPRQDRMGVAAVDLGARVHTDFQSVALPVELPGRVGANLLAEGRPAVKVPGAPTATTAHLNARPANDAAVERWAPILGFLGYHVSSHGRVSSPNGPVRPFLSSGYLKVNLRRSSGARRAYVHSLVAEAFLGPRPSRAEVDHLDFDKANPRLENLEYVTHSENIRRAAAAGLLGRPGMFAGEKHHAAVLTDEKVREIKRRRIAGERLVDLAEEFGVSVSQIAYICRGKSWGHVAGVPLVARPSKKRMREIKRAAALVGWRRVATTEPSHV